MLRTKDPALAPDEVCAGCGEPVEEGLVERCLACSEPLPDGHEPGCEFGPDAPVARCADCGWPIAEGFTVRCEPCGVAERARAAMELAQRLGTTPALRRVFAATVKRARAVLAGGRA